MKLLWANDAGESRFTHSLAGLSGSIAAAGVPEAASVPGSSSFDSKARSPQVQCVISDLRLSNKAGPAIAIDPDADQAIANRATRTDADAVLGLEADEAQVRQGELGAATPRSRVAPPVRGAWHDFLVGESMAMQVVNEVIRLIGPRKCTVLITGETGTGKELVARAIHLAGPRSKMPLVAVNCAALPTELLEAELFGHVKGAFTGAGNYRVGRIEQANRGTLFLDEIGDMPFELQAKLLRVLQEREFQRLGSSETVRVDVRFIAASNIDLERAVEEGRFREDLYYRLNVVPIPVPPLRDRQDDIPLLAEHLIQKICRSESIPLKKLDSGASRALAEFDWPGNVRQLENAVESAVALSGSRTLLEASDFRLGPARRKPQASPHLVPFVSVPDHGLDFERTVGRFEREILEQALRKTGGNKKRAAEMLRLKRTTLAAKLKSLEEMAC